MPHLNGDIVFTMLKGVVTNGKKFLWFSIKNKNNSKKKKKKKSAIIFSLQYSMKEPVSNVNMILCVFVYVCVCVYVCV